MTRVLWHWLSQRLTALILLPSLLYFLTALIYMTHCFEYPVYNLESISLMFIALTLRGWADGIILFGVLVLCFLHLVEGAQSIVDDYVHEECTKTLVGFVFGVWRLVLIKILFVWLFLF